MSYVQGPFNSLLKLAKSHLKSGKEIVLYDGVCHFCNSFVRFVVENDKKDKFFFVHLQSELGKELLKEKAVDSSLLDTVVLISEEKVFTYSTAVLKICKQLSWPIPILYVFVLVPSLLRNSVYIWIAKHRYSWFGKQEKCILPDEKIKAKLLMDE